jgi:hypothetical protein
VCSFAVLLSGALLLISLLHYLSGPTGVTALVHLKWVAIGAIAVGIFPIAHKGFIALRNKVSAQFGGPANGVQPCKYICWFVCVMSRSVLYANPTPTASAAAASTASPLKIKSFCNHN